MTRTHPTPAELTALVANPLWAPVFSVDRFNDLPEATRKACPRPGVDLAIESLFAPSPSSSAHPEVARFWSHTWPSLVEAAIATHNARALSHLCHWVWAERAVEEAQVSPGACERFIKAVLACSDQWAAIPEPLLVGQAMETDLQLVSPATLVDLMSVGGVKALPAAHKALEKSLDALWEEPANFEAIAEKGLVRPLVEENSPRSSESPSSGIARDSGPSSIQASVLSSRLPGPSSAPPNTLRGDSPLTAFNGALSRLGKMPPAIQQSFAHALLSSIDCALPPLLPTPEKVEANGNGGSTQTSSSLVRGSLLANTKLMTWVRDVLRVTDDGETMLDHPALSKHVSHIRQALAYRPQSLVDDTDTRLKFWVLSQFSGWMALHPALCPPGVKPSPQEVGALVGSSLSLVGPDRFSPSENPVPGGPLLESATEKLLQIMDMMDYWNLDIPAFQAAFFQPLLAHPAADHCLEEALSMKGGEVFVSRARAYRLESSLESVPTVASARGPRL